jgi:hypothetical protein
MPTDMAVSHNQTSTRTGRHQHIDAIHGIATLLFVYSIQRWK